MALLGFLIFTEFLGKEWYLRVLLIYTSLMRNESEHSILSLGPKNYVLMTNLSFAHFPIRFWLFFPLWFQNLIYFRDMILSFVIYVANISFQVLFF